MDRVIRKEAFVGAPLAEVWRAWTTSEGAATFFAPEAHIEAREGGAYEIYFLPKAEPGGRGSDGCVVLALQPPDAAGSPAAARLRVSWNAPPRFPEVRDGGRHTWVDIRFTDVDHHGTSLDLEHGGWRQGGRWDEVFVYFLRAWDTVLERLERRFRDGPIDWGAPDA